MTAISTFHTVWRYERRPGQRTTQGRYMSGGQWERLDTISLLTHGAAVGAVALPLRDQAFDIEIGKDQLAVKAVALRLSQQQAVFRDQGMAGENQIGTRFVRPGRSVGIGGQTACGMR